MVTAKELFKENPSVFDEKPIQYDVWLEVNTQATRHTQRSDYNDLYEINRPHEEEVYAEWRNSNKRQVTVAETNRFTSMLHRVLRYSSVSHTEVTSIDEDFGAILNENPFVHIGRRMSVEEFRYNCIIPTSLNDPNAIIVEFPYNPENKSEPIFENMDQRTLIKSDSIVIPFYDIIVYPEDDAIVFGWKHGYMDISDNLDEEDLKPYYFMVDEFAYYRYTPRKEYDKIVYDEELWYTHGLERLPIAQLPSRMHTFTHKQTQKGNNKHEVIFGDKFTYQETFISNALSYFDEAIIRLSQDQVNMVRHLDPRFYMLGDVDCPECHGKRTVSKRKAGFGSPLVEGTCQTCQGSGLMPAELGAFSTFRMRSSAFPSDKAPSGAPMGYVTPPTANLDISNRSWREWLEMGIRALAIDPVGGTANESGEAKKYRINEKEDIVREYGDAEISCIEKVLNNKRDLILGIKNDYKDPIKIPRPTTYNVKNADVLREEYEQAPASLKHKSFMGWISAEYRGDEKTIATYSAASSYAPLMHYGNNVSEGLNIAYEPVDLVRRDYAVQAFTEIFEDMDIEEIQEYTIGELRVMADEWLLDNGLIEIGEDMDNMGGAGAVSPEAEGGLNTAAEDEILSNSLLTSEEGNIALSNIFQRYESGSINERQALDEIILYFNLSEEAANELFTIYLQENEIATGQADLGAAEDVGEEEEELAGTGSSASQVTDNQSIEAIILAYTSGQLDREELIAQLVELTGRTPEEIEQLLQNNGL